ncbi:MAG TPA: DsbA family protein [Myxococcales bacterium]|jgi:predicted DsbA family dithiol-disulfide isomerase
MREPVRLSFFHDVLCAYCCVTAHRLAQLEEEFGDLVRVDLRAYPLRLEPEAPSKREVRRQVRLVKKAAGEPEHLDLDPALWRSIDPPNSSLPPLVALEAARLQGRCAERALAQRLRDAAFRFGLNVTRRDVLFELADATGLQMDRFATAFDAPGTLRAVEESRLEAMRRGVSAIPAVVIGQEWSLTGVRELHEYRDVLQRWWERRGGTPSPRALN